MKPLMMLTLAGGALLLFKGLSGASPAAAPKTTTVKGPSGTTWNVQLLRVDGDTLFHTIFTASGTKVVGFRAERGPIGPNNPRFNMGGPPNVDPAIVAKAVSDFNLRPLSELSR